MGSGPRDPAEADTDPSTGPEAGADGDGGSVFGPRPDEGPTELVPGTPDPENVLFVVLGVATSLVLVGDLVGVL